jgi:hypothetical protein
MTIRGEPAFGRGSIAPQPCIRWVQGPNHDAAMRIGSEAPRRRTHSSSRHDSHESPRDPATSNRHRRPVTGGRAGPKLSGAFSDLRSLRRAHNDAVRHHALPHQPPQGDQKLARQGHDHGLARATGGLGAGCVTKTKSERIDDEARPRWRAKLWRRIAEPDERPAHPFAKTDAF